MIGILASSRPYRGRRFARQLRIFRCGGQEVVEATLFAAIVIEKEQTRWLNGKNLKTDGERIQWLSENLSAVMGMLHRETEQINALQQRVQVLEEEIEKLIGLPLWDVP